MLVAFREQKPANCWCTADQFGCSLHRVKKTLSQFKLNERLVLALGNDEW